MGRAWGSTILEINEKEDNNRGTDDAFPNWRFFFRPTGGGKISALIDIDALATRKLGLGFSCRLFETIMPSPSTGFNDDAEF